jgi:hypothetical protein
VASIDSSREIPTADRRQGRLERTRWRLGVGCHRAQKREGLLAKALGPDLKGKISPVLYIIAIVFAFFVPVIADAI